MTDSTSKPAETLGDLCCRLLASDTFNENKGFSRPHRRNAAFGVTLLGTMKEDEHGASVQHISSYYLSVMS